MQTPKVYITTSLLNSHYYYMHSKPEQAESKKAEFLAALRKEPFEPNELIRRGWAFEDKVRALSEGKSVQLKLSEVTKPNLDELQTAAEIAALVQGGQWQVPVEKWIKVNGLDVLLYGKADVIKDGVIIDVKRTSSYQLGKYAVSPQHDIYMLCRNVPKFIYLASDGKDVWPEEYRLTKDTEARLSARIADFYGWLQTAGLWETYLTHWKTKGA